jgi:hypothetical protein
VASEIRTAGSMGFRIRAAALYLLLTLHNFHEQYKVETEASHDRGAAKGERPQLIRRGMFLGSRI